MSRYKKKFAELKKQNRKAFIPFAVLGYPTYKASLKILRLYLKHADILELGIPFSDPIADGKVIQAADTLALKNGMNTDKAFKLISKIRKINFEIPIGLLVYCNLVYRYGINNFYRKAKQAGVDSILVADLSFEEAKPYLKAAKKFHLEQIFIVAPTTPDSRIKKICRSSSGFIYAVSLTGVTGARKKLSKNAKQLVKRIKKLTSLPVCVGFGISTKKQAKEVLAAGADGYIVGSALIMPKIGQIHRKMSTIALNM